MGKGAGVLRLSSSVGGKTRYCYERSSDTLFSHALLLNGANRVDNFKISSSAAQKEALLLMSSREVKKTTLLM